MDILETVAYDRRKHRHWLWGLSVSLLPFFLSSCLFFHLWIPESNPSLFAAVIKAAPVLSLALVVLYHNWGRGLGCVPWALLLSAGGDAFLIWPEYFLHGMVCFGLAHLLYCFSFLSLCRASSCSPCHPLYLPLSLSGASLCFYLYLLPFLLRRADATILAPAVGGYCILLVSMATIALATGRPLTWGGAFFFMTSDVVLSLQVFEVLIVPAMVTRARAIVMVTYYLGQLLIAVGDVRAGSEVTALEARLGPKRKRK
ncbi:lysoplasmalogenase [Amia ocellicauda]|uniref:lysoplasmalogenase n=1 Tax=Amia ocellicauda TaxID=2972642 RepID=UPI003464033E